MCGIILHILKYVYFKDIFSLITKVLVPILFSPFCFSPNLRILSVFPFRKT